MSGNQWVTWEPSFLRGQGEHHNRMCALKRNAMLRKCTRRRLLTTAVVQSTRPGLVWISADWHWRWRSALLTVYKDTVIRNLPGLCTCLLYVSWGNNEPYSRGLCCPTLACCPECNLSLSQGGPFSGINEFCKFYKVITKKCSYLITVFITISSTLLVITYSNEKLHN